MYINNLFYIIPKFHVIKCKNVFLLKNINAICSIIETLKYSVQLYNSSDKRLNKIKAILTYCICTYILHTLNYITCPIKDMQYIIRIININLLELLSEEEIWMGCIFDNFIYFLKLNLISCKPSIPIIINIPTLLPSLPEKTKNISYSLCSIVIDYAKNIVTRYITNETSQYYNNNFDDKLSHAGVILDNNSIINLINGEQEINLHIKDCQLQSLDSLFSIINTGFFSKQLSNLKVMCSLSGNCIFISPP